MVTEFIENAWKAYKKNFWQIIGAVIVLSVIIFGIMIVSFLPLLTVFMTTMVSEEIVSEGNFSGISTKPSSQMFSSFILQNLSSVLAYSLIGIIIAFILSIELGAGLIGIYRDALKRKAKIKMMFSIVKKKFWTILGANLLKLLILVCIFVLTLSPSIISILTGFTVLSLPLLIIGVMAAFLLSLLFSLVNQAVVIGNERSIDAVKKSYYIVKENYLELFGLVIILTVISFIIALIPVVGGIINWLVVTPIFELAITSFYMSKSKTKRKKKR